MSDDEPVPDALRRRRVLRWGEHAWAALGIGFAALAIVWITLQLLVVVVPITVALLIAALLIPAANRLERAGVPRLAATWLLLLLMAAFIAAVTWLVVPAITTEAASLRTSVSDGLTKIEDWLVTGPLSLSRTQVDAWGLDLRSQAGSLVSTFAKGALARAPLALEVVAGAVLSVVLAFFFVKDGPRLGHRIEQAVGPGAANRLLGSWQALEGYSRAMVVNAIVNAAVIGIAVLLLGVPLAGPITAVTFLASFVPIIGAIAAGIIATLVALVAAGPTTAIALVGVTIAVHHLEGYVVGPLVVRHHTGAHPVVLVVALVAGLKIGGLAGGFLAGPITVACVGALARGDRAKVPEKTPQVRSEAPPPT